MTDSFEKLRKAVFTELEKQKAQTDNAEKITKSQRFGAFLEACLKNLGRSRADFARQLVIERELADAILDGLLPESEIDDEFLIEIAKAINYEPNLLRVMLERSTSPTLRQEDV